MDREFGFQDLVYKPLYLSKDIPDQELKLLTKLAEKSRNLLFLSYQALSKFAINALKRGLPKTNVTALTFSKWEAEKTKGYDYIVLYELSQINLNQVPAIRLAHQPKGKVIVKGANKMLLLGLGYIGYIYDKPFHQSKTFTTFLLEKDVSFDLYMPLIKGAAKVIDAPKRPFVKSDLFFANDSPQATYYPLAQNIVKNKKWGQLKLLLNEITVFALYPLHKKVNVVYAGAASGEHFAISVRLFPNVTWHLYDPREVMVNHPNVKKYKSLFTNETAAKWAGRDDVVFFSDIRRKGFTEIEALQHEVRVDEDMRMQQEWVTIIEPEIACLKMRLPYVQGYETGDVYNYLDGDVAIQPYIGHSSSESRLIVQKKDGYATKDYDPELYESQFFYHSMVTRLVKEYNMNGRNYSYDESAFLYLLDVYAKVYNVPKSSLVLKKEIIDQLNSMLKNKRFDI